MAAFGTAWFVPFHACLPACREWKQEEEEQQEEEEKQEEGEEEEEEG